MILVTDRDLVLVLVADFPDRDVCDLILACEWCLVCDPQCVSGSETVSGILDQVDDRKLQGAGA